MRDNDMTAVVPKLFWCTDHLKWFSTPLRTKFGPDICRMENNLTLVITAAEESGFSGEKRN
jgi:hypothetical protein